MTADYCFSHANEYLTAIIPCFLTVKTIARSAWVDSLSCTEVHAREKQERSLCAIVRISYCLYSFPITLAILFFTVFSPPNSPISGTNCFRRFSCDHADSYPVAILKAFLGVREDWGLGWGARGRPSLWQENFASEKYTELMQEPWKIRFDFFVVSMATCHKRLNTTLKFQFCSVYLKFAH